MSLPTTSHQIRKPAYRCMPEIHASRLAISGSLRPKIGLLLLLIVLIVSLCFLLVPILSKLSISSSKRQHIPSFPLLEVFDDISKTTSANFVVSPDLIISSMALLTNTSSPCGLVHKNSSSVTISGRVFTDKEVSNSCPGVIGEQIVIRSENGLSKITKWLNRAGIQKSHIAEDIKGFNYRSLIVSTSSIIVHLPGPAPLITQGEWKQANGITKSAKFTVVRGNYKIASLPSYSVIKMESFHDGLELYFLLPHSLTLQTFDIEWEDFNLSEFGTKISEIYIPTKSIYSCISLSKPLGTLGYTSEDTGVYQINDLKFEFMASNTSNSTKISSKDRDFASNSKLTLDHTFVIMVREVGAEMALMIGRVSSPG